VLELSSGRPAEAARAFRRAVDAEPTRGDAWQGLGAALLERDRPGAIEAWRQAERLLPQDYDLLFNLGMVLAEGSSPREALPYLQRFAREAPRARYGRDITRVQATIRRVQG
jgi:Flp pilus assembly protein TadD